MAFDDPARLDLRSLFRDPAMFDSRSSWRAAGFAVVDRPNNGKIMVARHPSVKGLLFKKYASSSSQRDQRKNYERRREGSRKLRAFIGGRCLTSLVVPHKWVMELPRDVFRREPSHVLLVEQLELLGDEDTKLAYQAISQQVLIELCRILFHFRGMDSNAKNLPFTTGGQIALIDTEHWDRGSSKAHLHHVGEYLSRERRKQAEKIFARLEEDGERSTFREGAPALDDFEEDTSSSSS